jgi:hypothetical protein
MGRTARIIARALAVLAGLSPLPFSMAATAQDEADKWSEPVFELFATGEYDPADFGYLRGAFPDASEEENRRWQQVAQWLQACEDNARSRAAADLSEIGLSLSQQHVKRTKPVCDQVITREDLAGVERFDQLSGALAVARLVFDTLRDTAENAKYAVQEPDASFAARLEAMVVPVDLLLNVPGGPDVPRKTSGSAAARRFPQLGDDESALLVALVRSELVLIDDANTQELSQIVKEHGWQGIVDAGPSALAAALQVLERSDYAPLFQAQSLSALEHLSESGADVPGFPAIYDRIMLRLSGVQRYGTQGECVQGVWQLHKFEDPDRVDALRAKAGLVPLDGQAGSVSSGC